MDSHKEETGKGNVKIKRLPMKIEESSLFPLKLRVETNIRKNCQLKNF